ncbi:MAG: hypothetical protein V1656_03100 [Candidatus Jorgensenbacteria bacterium]
MPYQHFSIEERERGQCGDENSRKERRKMQNSVYIYNIAKQIVKPLLKGLVFDRNKGTAHGLFLSLAPQVKVIVEQRMDPEMLARICASDTLTSGPLHGTDGFIRRTSVRDVLLKDISTRVTSMAMLREIVVAIIVAVTFDEMKQDDYYRAERARQTDVEKQGVKERFELSLVR